MNDRPNRLNPLRRVSNGTIPTAIHVCSFCKLSATASRRTPTTCVTWPTTTVRTMMPHRTSIEVTRCSKSDTPSTSATTDTAVSAPIDNCDVCLVAPADGSTHCTVPCGHRRFCGPCAEEVHNSVVLCVEVRFKCCCVCFNCVSRFFRIVCAMCGDFYS